LKGTRSSLRVRKSGARTGVKKAKGEKKKKTNHQKKARRVQNWEGESRLPKAC